MIKEVRWGELCLLYPWQSDKLFVPFIKIKESIPTFNQWVILNKMMEWLSSGMMFLVRESSVC